MTKLPFSRSAATFIILSLMISLAFPILIMIFIAIPLKITHALGSGSTIAVTSAASATVCGIVAAKPVQRIICYRSSGEMIKIQPEISFSSISGGDNFFCGLISGGYAFLCWNTFNFTSPTRVYINVSSPLQKISVGVDQVCAILNNTDTVKCWRGDYYSSGKQSPAGSYQFISISSGYGFTCGILTHSRRIRCWGSNPIASEIESQFQGISMVSIEAGGHHVCGINSSGFLVCKGQNFAGQLDIPSVNSPLTYSQFGLGANHSCAIRSINGSVVCWGGRGMYSVEGTEGVSFESVVSGSNFSCGLVTRDFSVICWGPGWINAKDLGVQILPFSDQILPGQCVRSACEGRMFPDSDRLCFGSGNICYPPTPSLTFYQVLF